MRTLIICCAAATLALAACQRPAEETADTPVAEDAAMAPADAGGAGAGATPAAGGSSAPAATDAAADTAATAPMEDGVRANAPVDQETRDGAKQRAEETNLHPRT